MYNRKEIFDAAFIKSLKNKLYLFREQCKINNTDEVEYIAESDRENITKAYNKILEVAFKKGLIFLEEYNTWTVPLKALNLENIEEEN